jgi:hypothetical protein
MATTNFGFAELSGSGLAGYNGINSLIVDIDTKLYQRVAVPGMIMLWATGSVPTGWEELTGATTPSSTDMNNALGTPPGTVKWIKKV